MKLRAILLAFGLLAMLPVSSAHAVAATDVFVYEAYAFRSIIDDDDLFIVFRYELPVSIADATTDAWCLELNDTTGCDAEPAAPTDPTSLQPGSVIGTIYSDGYGGTLIDQINLKRIDHAIGGLYLDAGHSITWGNAVTQICVESSTSLYTSPTHECLFPTWSAAANVKQDQLDSLEALMKGPAGPMITLESARLLADNSLVNGVNLITPAGQVFALEALSFMDRIIPGAFQIGAGSTITGAVATPTGDSDIQVMIDATAAASGVTEDLENVAQQYLGISGPTMSIAGWFMAGVLLGGIMWAFTKSQPLMLLGALTPLTWGIWTRGPTFAVIAAMITVFATLGSWYFVRKAPQ